MKKNDFVLPIILILLVFTIPCSIYGIQRQKKENSTAGNPNHLPKVDNTLYFYDEKDELLGTYECAKENCNRAVTTIDDTVNIHEDAEGTIVPYVNNEYVFIQDGNVIKMNAIKTGKTIQTFRAIKNYGVGIKDDLYILISEDGDYGLYNIRSAQFLITLSDGYKYMALQGDKDKNGYIDTQKIIVTKEHLHYLIDIDGEELSTPSTNPIYFYEDDYIYYKTVANLYVITDYTLSKILDFSIKDIRIYKECNVVRDGDGAVKVYTKDYQDIIFEKAYGKVELEFELKDKKLIITDLDTEETDEIDVSGKKPSILDEDEQNEE